MKQSVFRCYIRLHDAVECRVTEMRRSLQCGGFVFESLTFVCINKGSFNIVGLQILEFCRDTGSTVYI